MKLKRLTTILCLACFAVGCNMVYDDRSNCPPEENVTILFNYTAAGGADIFEENISSVDAFIYDAQNCFVMQRRLEESDLDALRGMTVYLEPGDYRIVAWGNFGSNSAFNDCEKGTTTFGQCFAEIPAAVTTTGDRVFYAPYVKHPDSKGSAKAGTFGGTRGGDEDYAIYTFTVPARGNVVKEIEFVRAHRTVNVYVQGFTDKISGVEAAPLIDGTQLWTRYDFFLTTQPQRRDFCQTAGAVSTADGPAMLATFHSAFGEITGDVEFVLRKASDGSTVHTVNLLQFLTENPAAWQDTIDIMIKFTDLGVKVTIPSWKDKTVTPGA